MSDLRHQDVPELLRRKQACERYISTLQSKLNAENQRLLWINKYIYKKTAKELTMLQIEEALGHRVILR